jgi:hypothetical protein
VGLVRPTSQNQPNVVLVDSAGLTHGGWLAAVPGVRVGGDHPFGYSG